MNNDKFVANIMFRVKKIFENNPSFYTEKGNEGLDEIQNILEAKKDSVDKIINDIQKVKKDIQEKLDLSKTKINTMKQTLLESLGVSNENN